ncbi:holin [Streptomyces sp. NPDC094034]|uniref:holin n=1 Tax=Streptomyces sp. NPDC094034 TaxID=3155309 RepID=UPI003327A574
MASASLFTPTFWLATDERAVRTFAQTLLAALGLDAADLLALPWGRGLALAGIATVLSVATSLLTVGTGNDGPGVTETPYGTSLTAGTGGNP